MAQFFVIFHLWLETCGCDESKLNQDQINVCIEQCDISFPIPEDFQNETN